MATTILVSPELYHAQAALESAPLGAAPAGLEWLPRGLSLPAARTVLGALEFVALSSAVTTLLGYWSRLSSALLTLSAGLVFAVSQLGGATLHNMHLFWMTALLSVSRAGDAWSLDSWGTTLPTAQRTYGVPLMFARSLLATVYFFPGVHKLATSGLHWVSAENVINHMHAKWFQTGVVPAWRVDEFPLLCQGGAALVVAFEIAAPVLFLVPRLRLLGCVAGFAFHTTTDLFMAIRFTSLLACYVVLLPWDRLVARIAVHRPSPASDAARTPSLRGVTVVGFVLLGGSIIAGALGKTQAWPFACYPTFAHLQGPTVPDLVLRTRRSDGRVELVDDRRGKARTQAEWRRIYFLMGAYPQRPPPAAVEAYAVELLKRTPRRETLEGAELCVARYESAPERWGAPPRRTETLWRVPVKLLGGAERRSGSHAAREAR